MSTFEELLKKTEKDAVYEKMKRNLANIVINAVNPPYLADFLTPFLVHIKHPSLTAFHKTLETTPISYLALPGIIHNMIQECKTNQKMYKVIDVMIRTFM